MTIKVKRKAPRLKLPDDITVIGMMNAEQGIQDQSQFNVLEKEGRRMDETQEEYEERKRRELKIAVPEDE